MPAKQRSQPSEVLEKIINLPLNYLVLIWFGVGFWAVVVDTLLFQRFPDSVAWLFPSFLRFFAHTNSFFVDSLFGLVLDLFMYSLTAYMIYLLVKSKQFIDIFIPAFRLILVGMASTVTIGAALNSVILIFGLASDLIAYTMLVKLLSLVVVLGILPALIHSVLNLPYTKLYFVVIYIFQFILLLLFILVSLLYVGDYAIETIGR